MKFSGQIEVICRSGGTNISGPFSVFIFFFVVGSMYGVDEFFLDCSCSSKIGSIVLQLVETDEIDEVSGK